MYHISKILCKFALKILNLKNKHYEKVFFIIISVFNSNIRL
jgi:hypothetical protein